MLGVTLALCGFAVQGAVHTPASNEPIPHVLVETVDGSQRAETDSAGQYRFACLPPTTHAIRFSRIGFDSRTVEVVAADGATLQLDVELFARPLALPPVVVAGMPERGGQDGPGRSDTPGLGISTFTTRELSQSPLVDRPDPLLALPVPDVLTAGDPLPGLHVRGGSPDQNLTLLDGVPVYNPYHAGAVSALSASAVSRVTLQSGVPSARWSGGLSSVANAETRTADHGGVAWYGLADPLWIGQFVSSRISGGAGDILAGGRIRNEFLTLHDHGHGVSGGDGLARVMLPRLGGDLELLVFGSQDRVGFDVGVGQSGDRTTDILAGATPGNTFASVTQTEAVMWRGLIARRATLDLRVWRAAFDATANWLAGAPLLAESGLRNVGAAAVVSGTAFSSQGEIGVEANRLGTTIAVHDVGPAAASNQLLNQTAAPVVLAAFIEDRWHAPSGRLGITVGLRSDFAPWGGVGFEPRVTVRYAPDPAVSLAAGYGESRQYVQSLANPESIIGTMVGFAFPMAADGIRFPVGRAAQSGASLTVRPGSGTTLSVDAYLRRMDGLLLVAPVTAQPFATSGVAVGSGRASGVLLSFAHQTPRITVQAIYAFGVTTRTAPGMSYSPTADATHSLAAGINLRAREGISVRADFRASVGRRTSLIGDSLAWSPATELGGIGDLDGSPQDIRGPLDGQSLPSYLRLDLGLRREWSSILGHGTRLRGSITVTNVLGRANVAAMLAPVNALTAQALSPTPRSVSLRLEWNPQ